MPSLYIYGGHIMQEISQLLTYYFREISPKHRTSISANKRLADLISSKLKEGMTPEQIISKFHDLGEQIDNYIASKKEQSPIKNPGLIEPGKYYFHSQLRKPVPPIQSYQDEDGNTVWVNVDEYNGPEMVESYTIDQLLDYYYRSFNIPEHLKNVPRDKGALKHIVGKRGIELTLFMIDAAVGDAIENDTLPSNPLQIDNYLRDGIERYNYKVNILREAGEQFELAR